MRVFARIVARMLASVCLCAEKAAERVIEYVKAQPAEGIEMHTENEWNVYVCFSACSCCFDLDCVYFLLLQVSSLHRHSCWRNSAWSHHGNHCCAVLCSWLVSNVYSDRSAAKRYCVRLFRNRANRCVFAEHGVLCFVLWVFVFCFGAHLCIASSGCQMEPAAASTVRCLCVVCFPICVCVPQRNAKTSTFYRKST